MKKAKLGFILLFLGILVLPTLIWGAVGLVAPGAFESGSMVEEEKREKAAIRWSELLSDGSSINDWYQDRAPFRSLGIGWYRSLNNALESGYNKDILPALSQLLYSSPQSPSPGTPAKTPLDLLPTAFIPGEMIDLPPASQTPSRPAETTAAPTEKTAQNPTSTEESASSSDGTETSPAAETTALSQSSEASPTEPTETPTEAALALNSCGHSQAERVWLKAQSADYDQWGYTAYRCQICGYTDLENIQPKLVDDSFLSPRTQGNVIFGRNNWLFFSGNNTLEYYKGTNLLEDSLMQTFLQKMQNLEAICQAKGIRLALFFAPNKDQVYSEYMPSYTVENEYKRIVRLTDYLRAHLSSPVLYPLQELKEADLYYRTYYPRDSHWNMYGSFVGTMLLFKSLGLEYVDPFSLSLPGEVKEDGYFDLIALAEMSRSDYPTGYSFNPLYKNDIQILSESSVENNSVIRSASSNPNGLKLVYLGDSFRIMQLEYLKKSFSQALIAHRDYTSEYMKEEILACDYLILECVERTDTKVFETVDRLISILSN